MAAQHLPVHSPVGFHPLYLHSQLAQIVTIINIYSSPLAGERSLTLVLAAGHGRAGAGPGALGGRDGLPPAGQVPTQNS